MRVITDYNITATDNNNLVVSMDRIEAGEIEKLLWLMEMEELQKGELGDEAYIEKLIRMRAVILSYICPANYDQDRFEYWNDHQMDFELIYKRELDEEAKEVNNNWPF